MTGETKKAQIINAPHTIKVKVNEGGPGAVSLETLQKAEAVIADMADDYMDWVSEDLTALQAAYDALAADLSLGKAGLDKIYTIAHDMKGQGGSFGYDLITVIGNELCRFVEPLEKLTPSHMAVIELHLSTMRLVVAQKITGNGGEQGNALLDGLEKVVAKVGGG